MSWAYVDSSVVIATLCGEIAPKVATNIWNSADNFVSSFLLEVEVLSVAKREGLDFQQVQRELLNVGLVRTGSLQSECRQILGIGYLRGADLFHLASAIWIQGKYSDLSFLTLDKKQRDLARMLGFNSI